ncbi:hypothetical protein E2C01_062737 [Portunus trituberculatus]|uniref:Uncharacterized protein n=1 Tax=Portunus trituberculatus TaxID=210409 RepID=A0A5B7HG31_PORTR|nr:hypothetical protein [Portunus trituberculatus]
MFALHGWLHSSKTPLPCTSLFCFPWLGATELSCRDGAGDRCDGARSKRRPPLRQSGRKYEALQARHATLGCGSPATLSWRC